MSKRAALILSLFFLFSIMPAFAESHPTPNINDFARMKVKISDSAISIAFDLPVDRLFINWTDGSDPQELLVDENLKAYGFRAGHKYLPGIQEHVSNCVSRLVYNGKTVLFEDIQIDPVTGREAVREIKTYQKIEKLKHTDDLEKKIREFTEKYGEKYQIEYDEPKQVFDLFTDEQGYTYKLPRQDENGEDVYEDGEIRAYTFQVQYFATNIATPDQIAFITLQDEWIVCYNRSGQIVSVDYNENQF